MSAPLAAGAPAARSWTVLELLRWTTTHFASAGIESPRLDAECLLAFALGRRRIDLYLEFEKPVTLAERARFRELVRRRARERVPVAQLVGVREFWSLPIEVTPDVLTPRPETETLVEAALACCAERDAAWRVLDVGTGSGALALALAHERPRARVLATDVSRRALAVAARNAERLGLAGRVRFAAGSLLEPVADGRFDLVVSNPPYLADAERATLAPELAHEPPLALFAGADGTALLRRIVAQAGRVLAPGGWLLLETAPQQAEVLTALCAEHGLAPAPPRRDLAGRRRVLAARAPQPATDVAARPVAAVREAVHGGRPPLEGGTTWIAS